MNISMKLVYQYMVIFLTFSPTSSHLYPLHVEKFSNLRLVVDEDDNDKFTFERIKGPKSLIYLFLLSIVSHPLILNSLIFIHPNLLMRATFNSLSFGSFLNNFVKIL